MNLKFLVTRSIYENPKISQRSLAKNFLVSLGKINAVLKDAEKEKLLVKDDSNNYSVTEKGKTEISCHKVDGALILACGMGIRLAPLTYDTPKSFIKIKNERMIERQIEQLKARGINDITIMVGYMKERFDYLIDKYNVKLIYNEEYKTKNTLSTFYHARDILKNKNMYVCVSDVYISDNIFHRYECEPYYIGAYYDDCKNEWRYIVNSKNEIKAVALGGKNDYCLVGPCFLTKEFLSKFIPMIENYYKKSSTDNFYWEDVLVQNFKKLPAIYLYKLPKNVIYEFDTISDLKKFDKESKSFGSEAISFVSRAFKTEDKNIKNIINVKEGMTNHSYRFTFDGVNYIARIPGEGTWKFINRKDEYEVYEKLKSKNITEEIVFFDKKTGYKIAKYFDNSKTISIKKKDELKNAMALYKKLHTTGVKVKANSDLVFKTKEYLNIIKKKDIYVPYEDFDEVLKKAKEIEKIIAKEKRPKTLCHGDANPNNILITKDGYKMIDFEYAGMADPISDIALFGAYVGFNIDKTYELYEMYRDAKIKSTYMPKDNKVAKRLIISYMAFAGLYNALWAIVRAALSGDDYGLYGMKGYRTFKTCYSQLLT